MCRLRPWTLYTDYPRFCYLRDKVPSVLWTAPCSTRVERFTSPKTWRCWVMEASMSSETERCCPSAEHNPERAFRIPTISSSVVTLPAWTVLQSNTPIFRTRSRIGVAAKCRLETLTLTRREVESSCLDPIHGKMRVVEECTLMHFCLPPA